MTTTPLYDNATVSFSYIKGTQTRKIDSRRIGPTGFGFTVGQEISSPGPGGTVYSGDVLPLTFLVKVTNGTTRTYRISVTAAN